MAVVMNDFSAAMRCASKRCAVRPANVSRTYPPGRALWTMRPTCAPRFSNVAALPSSSSTVHVVPLRSA